MTPIDPPEELLRDLRSGNRFLLTGHLNPDGDCVGSALGLAKLLSSVGKAAVIWNRDPTPVIYSELPGVERIHIGEAPPVSELAEHFDRVIALECPSLDRSGLDGQLDTLPVLNLDHHLGNENYGIVNWVDSGAPALGEMILRLSRALGIPLSQEAATTLLVALTSDTGGFRFANATARAFEAGALLVRSGAEPTLVSRWLYESRSKAGLLLLREMLGSLQVTADGRVASAVLSQEMFSAAGASAAHSEGMIDYPRSIVGVEAVVLVRQIDDQQCKVSLRSRGALDVERIARQHSGGGHRNAAGFVASGHVEEVRQQAVREIQQGIGGHED